MATEELLVRAVRAGGNRQTAHEVIRRHSIETAAAMKNGAANDLLTRLASDPGFGVPLTDLQDAAAPERYIGRAPEQVDEFLADVVQPLLDASPVESHAPEVRV